MKTNRRRTDSSGISKALLWHTRILQYNSTLSEIIGDIVDRCCLFSIMFTEAHEEENKRHSRTEYLILTSEYFLVALTFPDADLK